MSVIFFILMMILTILTYETEENSYENQLTKICEIYNLHYKLDP